MRPVPSGLAVTAVCSLLAVCATHARGQGGPNITLQLPTFHSFGVNTTVLVPDSGPAPLASERQAFYGRNVYGGLVGQRAIGVDRSVGGASVTAQVHDARAEDEALLRASRARRTNWQRGSTGGSGGRSGAMAAPGLKSVAEIERDVAQAAAARQREVRSFLEQARQARAEQKPGVAAVYYGMAARRADAPLRERIEAEARSSRGAPASR